MSFVEKEIIEGLGNITFEKYTTYAKIKNPLENFKLTEQKIEYRKDPLTQQFSRVNRLRADRIKQASLPGENFDENLHQLVENSSKKCFFCSENIAKSTPQFPDDLRIGERMIIGNFTLFPNLYVFSENHAVGVLGNEHFIKLHEFTKEIWLEALRGSIAYFKAVYQKNNQMKYPSINFNFLPPSASSIIHPHIQIIQDFQPTNYVNLLYEKSKDYTTKIPKKTTTKGNFWLDLIESEKKLNQRFITENNLIAWLSSYSPIGKDELIGIIKPPKTDITQFSLNELEILALDITKILKALYLGRGVTSVNMAMFLGPINDNLHETFRASIKIVSRPTLIPNYTCDIGFMELLHNEPIAAATPEMIAKTIKEYFSI